MVNTIDDFFVASVDENTFVAELAAFPNPSNGSFTISVNTNEVSEMNVEITNLVGQVVYHSIEAINSGLNSIKIELSDLAEGQYIVKMSNEKGIATTTIQVAK
jgi:hypothetical protein